MILKYFKYFIIIIITTSKQSKQSCVINLYITVMVSS